MHAFYLLSCRTSLVCFILFYFLFDSKLWIFCTCTYILVLTYINILIIIGCCHFSLFFHSNQQFASKQICVVVVVVFFFIFLFYSLVCFYFRVHCKNCLCLALRKSVDVLILNRNHKLPLFHKFHELPKCRTIFFF